MAVGAVPSEPVSPRFSPRASWTNNSRMWDGSRQVQEYPASKLLIDVRGTGEMPPPRPGEALPEGVEYVDLSQGEFQLVPTVGRSQATERDAALQHMAQIAEAAPGLVPMYADLWARAMGTDQIADRLKANNPAATGDDDDASRLSEVMQAFETLKTQHAAAKN